MRFGGCPVVDRDATADDFVASVESGNVVGIRAQNGAENVQVLEGGEIVFSLVERGCEAQPDSPCRLTLQRLEFRLVQLALDLTDDTRLSVEAPVIRMALPLELTDAGSGYLLPSGNSFQTCGSIDGRLQHGLAKSSHAAQIRFDERFEAVQVVGSFPILVHSNYEACDELELLLDVSLTAPLTQIPPP